MLLQSCLIFLVFFHSLMLKKGQVYPRYIISYQVGTGATRTMIEGANIHVFVFTDCKNNRFQKKLVRQNADI